MVKPHLSATTVLLEVEEAVVTAMLLAAEVLVEVVATLMPLPD
jgi:hypothetical protein